VKGSCATLVLGEFFNSSDSANLSLLGVMPETSWATDCQACSDDQLDITRQERCSQSTVDCRGQVEESIQVTGQGESPASVSGAELNLCFKKTRYQCLDKNSKPTIGGMRPLNDFT